ncbi:MAG: HAD family hydrolase [Snowella sp.]|nr:HAD family hydrolase [Snowella sp.]
MPDMNQPAPALKKALFLDRDGVVVNYIPYLSQPEQVQIPSGAGQALKQWQDAGYLLIVITNQAGVGRGYFTLDDVEAVHHCIRQKYQDFGVKFDAFFLCPHHPDDQCQCRKPSPYLLQTAAQQYGINLADSFFLGDAPSDLEAAIAAGCQPLLVLTGRGQETLAKIEQYSVKVPVFEQVKDTVNLLQLSKQEKARSPLFISLIPNLMGGEGHIIPYHEAVSQAVKKLNWDYQAIMPIHPGNQNLPQDWNACLLDTDLEAEGRGLEKLLRIKEAYALGVSIANYFRQHQKSDRPTIIFLERFIHLQLFSLTIALYLIPKNNLQVWLLYRRDVHQDKTRFIYKFLHQIIHKLLPDNQLRFLTDSDFLAHSLSNYFQEKMTVMPIPHTKIHCPDKAFNLDNQIYCWWPGSPRLEKGWDTLKAITQAKVQSGHKICLIAAENANFTEAKDGIKIKAVKNNLTRDEYTTWLCLSDIILLPYDADAYKERTSGIFTECIIAGKIPLVTPHTWMAEELKNYQLEALIIDWKDPQIVCNTILTVMASPDIKNQILAMQKNFKQFHNSGTYADTLKQIFFETKQSS